MYPVVVAVFVFGVVAVVSLVIVIIVVVVVDLCPTESAVALRLLLLSHPFHSIMTTKMMQHQFHYAPASARIVTVVAVLNSI